MKEGMKEEVFGKIDLSECEDGHFYWFQLPDYKRFPGQFVVIGDRKAILGIRKVIWLDDTPHRILHAIKYPPEREHCIHDFIQSRLNAEPLPAFTPTKPLPKRDDVKAGQRKAMIVLIVIAAVICTAIVVPALVLVIDPMVDHLFANGDIDSTAKFQAFCVIVVAGMAFGIGAAWLSVGIVVSVLEQLSKLLKR